LSAQNYVAFYHNKQKQRFEGGEYKMTETTKNTHSSHKERGFTLIELLVVIVILGILAGILITVLNPVRQQNRSRNATVRSGIGKVAYGLNSVLSATGTLPTEDQVLVELQNLALASGDTATAADPAINLRFNVPGVALPKTCGATAVYEGGGTTQCVFRMISGPLLDGHFRVIGKTWELTPTAVGTDDTYFVFDSQEGSFECPSATVPTLNMGTATDTSVLLSTTCTALTE
jgi:prepilin-type N-terminal cleavage/methylation domain-containing protein